MRIPVISMSFKDGDDDWEYAYSTINLLLLFYLIPARSRGNLTAHERFLKDFKVREMVEDFTDGDVNLSNEQCYVFLDGSDAIAKLMESGDPAFVNKMFSVVSNDTQRFATARDFKTYYLEYSKQTINTIRELFAGDAEALVIFNKIFIRWKQNCTYKQWCDRYVQKRDLN